jgi:hypothetical protein
MSEIEREMERGKREREKEIREILRFWERCISFLLEPWQSRTGLLPSLC